MEWPISFYRTSSNADKAMTFLSVLMCVGAKSQVELEVIFLVQLLILSSLSLPSDLRNNTTMPDYLLGRGSTVSCERCDETA